MASSIPCLFFPLLKSRTQLASSGPSSMEDTQQLLGGPTLLLFAVLLLVCGAIFNLFVQSIAAMYNNMFLLT